MGTGQVGINKAAYGGQLTRFEFGDGGTDLGHATDDFVAGNAWVNGLHEAAPLVARIVEVRVANAAVEDFDLHIAWRWFTSRDCRVSQRSCRTGSGIGFGFIHVIMLLFIGLRVLR
jgi:hypothetical protein